MNYKKKVPDRRKKPGRRNFKLSSSLNVRARSQRYIDDYGYSINERKSRIQNKGVDSLRDLLKTVHSPNWSSIISNSDKAKISALYSKKRGAIEVM